MNISFPTTQNSLSFSLYLSHSLSHTHTSSHSHSHTAPLALTRKDQPRATEPSTDEERPTQCRWAQHWQGQTQLSPPLAQISFWLLNEFKALFVSTILARYRHRDSSSFLSFWMLFVCLVAENNDITIQFSNFTINFWSWALTCYLFVICKEVWEIHSIFVKFLLIWLLLI